MSSQTSLVAEQVRLQQWAAQIQDCKNRPADMKVETWCRVPSRFVDAMILTV